MSIKTCERSLRQPAMFTASGPHPSFVMSYSLSSNNAPSLLCIQLYFLFVTLSPWLAAQLLVHVQRAGVQGVQQLGVWVRTHDLRPQGSLLFKKSLFIEYFSFQAPFSNRASRLFLQTFNSSNISAQCPDAECLFAFYGGETLYHKYLILFQFYNVFLFFWCANFVTALGQVTLSGAFASYYWAFKKPEDIPAYPIFASLGRALRLVSKRVFVCWVCPLSLCISYVSLNETLVS